ncbi:hypothetical protein PInf_006683 [Phytophthora infestans]|nr:hypothetical protein PInf_006683 [Phytophthora infestans]
MDAKKEYREALGLGLMALWPLLCDVFSGKPGCTGEVILESGAARSFTNGDDCESDGEESILVPMHAPMMRAQIRLVKPAQKPVRSQNNQAKNYENVVQTTTANQAAYMETQREANQALRQSKESLQQMSASAIDLFTEMKQQIRRNSS